MSVVLSPDLHLFRVQTTTQSDRIEAGSRPRNLRYSVIWVIVRFLFLKVDIYFVYFKVSIKGYSVSTTLTKLKLPDLSLKRFSDLSPFHEYMLLLRNKILKLLRIYVYLPSNFLGDRKSCLCPYARPYVRKFNCTSLTNLYVQVFIHLQRDCLQTSKREHPRRVDNIKEKNFCYTYSCIFMGIMVICIFTVFDSFREIIVCLTHHSS